MTGVETAARCPNPTRHPGKCSICHHPQREEIERDFLDWTSPPEIVSAYQLGSAMALYRHAHATGLFDLRRRNVQFALERVIEHVDRIEPTAAAVVAAIRLAIELREKQTDAAAPLRLREQCGESSPF